MSYVYINPINKGFTKFKLTKEQHNKIFKHSQIKWLDRYEYYYNEKMILLHKFYNWKAILLFTILFPFGILYEGLSNIKETYQDQFELYNQKKYGRFISNYIYNNSEAYQDIIKIIKN